MNGDGTGLPFGVNDSVLGFIILGGLGAVWALFYNSQKDLVSSCTISKQLLAASRTTGQQPCLGGGALGHKWAEVKTHRETNPCQTDQRLTCMLLLPYRHPSTCMPKQGNFQGI